MEQGSRQKFLFFPIVLSIFIFLCLGKSHGLKNQADVLGSFYRDKFFNKSKAIDTSDFEILESAIEDDDDLHATGPLDSNKVVGSPDVGLKEKDQIVQLPGQPPVQFNQYGGYVTVNASNGRAFFYYFVEAENSKKDSLPLLLWLNGGPGCSSLAYGAMEEHGPFRVHSDGKTLYRNKFSWNNAANVLFLESPAGVGFSYSNTSSDYDNSGDRRTAADNYAFLVNWFERFPEYRSRDFYISGESYAGHYVPQLAHHILALNKRVTNKDRVINLKGILIGNAVINDITDNIGMYDFFATHALMPEETAQAIRKYCDFSPAASHREQSPKCTAATHVSEIDVNDIDIYDIYAPVCHNSNLTSKPKRASVMKYEPCSDYYVYAYLNRPEVQEALHANVTKLKHDWQPCSDVITEWGDSPSTIIPLLQEFMANGLRVWVFSGDTDGRVPVTGTQYSINKMNLTVKTLWHPWYNAAEVGGYTQEYEGGLTFATVRGAGHMVPTHQPGRALSLVSHFLSGTPLPNTKKWALS